MEKSPVTDGLRGQNWTIYRAVHLNIMVPLYRKDSMSIIIRIYGTIYSGHLSTGANHNIGLVSHNLQGDRGYYLILSLSGYLEHRGSIL